MIIQIVAGAGLIFLGALTIGLIIEDWIENSE